MELGAGNSMSTTKDGNSGHATDTGLGSRERYLLRKAEMDVEGGGGKGRTLPEIVSVMLGWVSVNGSV